MKAPLTRLGLVMRLSWLGLALLGACLVALAFGSTSIDLRAALAVGEGPDARILWEHRLPRVLLGLAAGAVLGAAGATLQGLLRNALADPFIVGVSGGAALGAAAVGLTGLGMSIAEPVGGFIGAWVALVLVMALASRQGRISPLRMLLVGVVFNAFAGAVLMLLQAMAEPGAVQRVLLRLMGSLATDPSRPLVLPLVLGAAAAGLVPMILRARALDLLGFGEATARSLGVDTQRLERVLFLALSISIGAVVAVTGLIGFVGLMVPHLIRLAWGPDHRLLVPASALGGACLVVLADAAVRVAAVPLGTELPVGVLTTGLGGPLFIWLLTRDARRGQT